MENLLTEQSSNVTLPARKFHFLCGKKKVYPDSHGKDHTHLEEVIH